MDGGGLVTLEIETLEFSLLFRREGRIKGVCVWAGGGYVCVGVCGVCVCALLSDRKNIVDKGMGVSK